MLLKFDGGYMENKYQIPPESCSDKELQGFWSKVIVDQTTSGISMKKFCQQYQLSFSQLGYWKYKKQKTKAIYKRANGLNNRKDSKDIAKFIPLQIASDTLTSTYPKDNAVNKEESPPEIKIIFKNGNKLILPSTITEAKLLSVIKIASELRC